MKRYTWIIFKLSLLLFCIFQLNACVSVEAYQKIYLSDTDMELHPRLIEKGEMDAAVYREGASGANKGKSGGGCGCN